MAEGLPFSQLDALLDQALEQPAASRARWLARTCGPDSELMETLLRLVQLAEADPEVLPPSGGLRSPLVADLIGASESERTDDHELKPGDRLGRYEIRGLVGAGAMGRVYRGFDPALAREVAIKQLVRPRGPDASNHRRRFDREARLLATLVHPNIATIFGWELVDDVPYLILELVEGPTLADRIARGPLPMTEVMAIALQLAAALEEAHRKGVVHRDLKPANIALDGAGGVKVLDFGIAKVISPTEEALDGTAVTTAAVVLGTAPYMSPEQVRGESVDKRTDVWAFGCVLYEMVTGRRVFDGGSTAEVAAAVLRDPVDWSRLPVATPEGLLRLLRWCLERDVRNRLRDMGDVRLLLQELDRGPDVPAGVPPPVSLGWRAVVPWLVAAVGVGALGYVGGRLQPPLSVPRAARLSLELPDGLDLAGDYPAPFDVSPDGRRLVLLALQGNVPRLFLRQLDGTTVDPVPGTDGAWQPAFSGDGRSLVFFAERKLKKLTLGAPVATVLAETSDNQRGATEMADGSVVFSPSQTSGLSTVPAGGGAPVPLTELDRGRGEASHRWPQALPGGQAVLFTSGIDGAPYDDASVDAVSVSTGKRLRLVENGAHGRYAAGHLYFARAGRLYAVPFDAHSLAVRGEPQVVVDGVRYDPRNGGAHYAVAEGGTLVYGPAPARSLDSHVAWVDEAGQLGRISDKPRSFREPRLSPDGRRVAVRIGDERASDVWILETEKGRLTRASFGIAPRRPIWTPDGRKVTVSAEVDGGWRLLTLAPGTGTPATVVWQGPHRVYPNAWTPDGRALVFQERRPATGWDVRVVAVGPDGRSQGAPRELAATAFQEQNAAVSLDGLHVAYEADELDGIFGIYVAPFTAPGARARATEINARWPRWAPGDVLYCWNPPRARPGENSTPAGIHRIRWRAGGRERSSSEALWTDRQAARSLLSRLSVAGYAPYDVDLSARDPRFLVLEVPPAAPALLEQPVVVLDGLPARRGR